MTTGHVFIATSLDGFVSGTNRRLDWLMKQNTAGEQHGYEAFIESMDGIVMGRGSFETVLTFGAWPYNKQVIVMSQTLTDADLPVELAGKVRLTTLTPAALMDSLRDEGWKRAYVDGGLLVQSFLRCGLIEDLHLTIVPVLIGDGVRLFGPIEADVDLELTHSKSFKSGLVQHRYRVLPSAREDA
jgi:dihydrofolate reductase